MKKATFGIAALFMIGLVAIGAYALPWGNMNSNDQMQVALESGDYDAYMASFEQSDMPFMHRQMTEERFNEASERMQQRTAQHENIEAALEDGNYDAWLSAHEEMQSMRQDITDIVTAENFDVFVDMHEAREAGDFELAQQYADELGLEQPGFGGMGPGMHDGARQGNKGDRMGGQGRMNHDGGCMQG